MINKCLIFSAFLILFASNSFGQTGGDFTITQSVIAGGGGQQAVGGAFSLDGTIGQTLAETAPASGGTFSLRSGFWTSQFVPTAAAVSVGGQVKNAQGGGIRNVIVILTDASGVARTTTTGAFGFFRFDEVASGDTYIFSVSSKRYGFNQSTIIRTVLEEITDLDFIANDQ